MQMASNTMFFYSLLLGVFLLVSHHAQAQRPEMQARAPHGLAYESPLTLTPSAFDFFHPNTTTANKSQPARVDQVRATVWSSPASGAGRAAAPSNAAVAVAFAAVCVVLAVAMGAAYITVAKRRQANTSISKAIENA